VFLITALIMGVAVIVAMRTRETVMKAQVMTQGSAAEAMIRLRIASIHLAWNSFSLIS
jgi:hypothetical protein